MTAPHNAVDQSEGHTAQGPSITELVEVLDVLN
jgi:hypothetical protein